MGLCSMSDNSDSCKMRATVAASSTMSQVRRGSALFLDPERVGGGVYNCSAARPRASKLISGIDDITGGPAIPIELSRKSKHVPWYTVATFTAPSSTTVGSNAGCGTTRGETRPTTGGSPVGPVSVQGPSTSPGGEYASSGAGLAGGQIFGPSRGGSRQAVPLTSSGL